MTIIDLDDNKNKYIYKIGDLIKFNLDYIEMIRIMTPKNI